jgi:hypothetical protein
VARFQETLLNPTWVESVEREPLLAFSHHLSGRVSVLCSFAEEIIENPMRIETVLTPPIPWFATTARTY